MGHKPGHEMGHKWENDGTPNGTRNGTLWDTTPDLRSGGDMLGYSMLGHEGTQNLGHQIGDTKLG